MGVTFGGFGHSGQTEWLPLPESPVHTRQLPFALLVLCCSSLLIYVLISFLQR